MAAADGDGDGDGARVTRAARRRYGVGKTLAIMAGLALVLAWAAIFYIPTAKQLGLAPRAADKLPYLGLAVGAAWGLGIAYSASARAAAGYLVAPVLVGAVFWFFGVLAGGLLVGMGLDPDAAGYAPPVAFVLGAALGSAPFLALVADAVRPGRGARRSASQRRRPRP